MKLCLAFASFIVLVEGQLRHNTWNNGNFYYRPQQQQQQQFRPRPQQQFRPRPQQQFRPQPQPQQRPQQQRQGRGTIRITNRAPPDGTCMTPPWVGIHDGSFDIYDLFRPASAALERLAEDGNNDPLSDLFNRSRGAVYDNMVGMEPICPGQSATLDFVIDLVPNTNHYFSYASMVLPSNDAFVANADERSHLLFDRFGTMQRLHFGVFGSQALDAGTEINDELTSTTAFFGQEVPNTGRMGKGQIQPHPGFNRRGSGGILDSPDFRNADFRRAGYRFMDIEVFPSGNNGGGNNVFGSAQPIRYPGF